MIDRKNLKKTRRLPSLWREQSRSCPYVNKIKFILSYSPRKTSLYISCLSAITLMLMLMFGATVYAEDEYPEYEGKPIVDPHQYFESSQKNSYNEVIASSTYDYVIVFLDHVEEDGFGYAQELYEHFELEEQSILFLITVQDNAFYYTYDRGLREIGLTDELIEIKKEETYVRYADNREYLTGIPALIRALEAELESIQRERETAEQITVNEERSESEEQGSTTTMPWWLRALFILFVVTVLFFLAGMIYRRRLLKKVDQIEEWKIQIENRSFSTEFSKVKELKLSGEMERKFESWKNEWESILNQSLPDIEELLLDIEDYAYGFRFFKAASVLSAARQRMDEIDQRLATIVSDIDHLTSSEKHNREKITSLHEKYQLLRSQLQKEVMSLGISYPIWEEKLKKAVIWFDKFTAAQENGDYLTANDFIQAIEEVFEQIEQALEQMPACIETVEQHLPRKLQELERALQEMKDKGYSLSHTNVDEQFESLKKGKSNAVAYMENGQIEQLKAWIAKSEEKIEAIYHALEEEVETRKFVQQALEQLPEQKEETQKQYDELKTMIEETKASYAWETEWDEAIAVIDKQHTENQLLVDELIAAKESEQNDYPTMRKKLIHLTEQHDQLLKAISSLYQRLKRVREDEWKAKEVAQKLRQTLVKIKSIIRKSNLPGIPQHLQTGQEMAEESVQELLILLDQIPLDMLKVEHQLQDAKAQVESVTKVTQAVIEQATRTEQLIPYANRYRRTNPEIIPLLEESEQAFRQLQFREALEFAEQALDQAEPSWREVWPDEEVREA